MSLELKCVSKRIAGEMHIYPMDLQLERGSFNILLGATLSGKTTLMQLMAGLDRPTSGEIRFAGKDVTGIPVQKRNVSMVYQQFINYPNMTVYENIASPLRVARLDKKAIERRVTSVADLLKLTPMLKRRPNELSGGQQQRTALARALVKDADLVLLDEPLANLDFKLREELREELPKLLADRNCVVVYATTEPTEALLFGGSVATLHEGRMTQFGPTGEIYRRPKDLITAAVFSDPPINTAKAVKTGDEVVLGERVRWTIPDALRSLADGQYLVAIRPHHITPVKTGELAVPIEGRVLLTEISGSESIVHFDMGLGTWVSQSHGIHPLEVGVMARFYADIARATYFTADGERIAAEPGPTGSEHASNHAR